MMVNLFSCWYCAHRDCWKIIKLHIKIYNISGFCCALYDEGLGRVVEDYFHPCSDCPFVYQSDDASKCKNLYLKKKCISRWTIFFVHFPLINTYKSITFVLDSKCVGSIKETSTSGRYKKHTTIADEKNSIETSKVLTSQRSSFFRVYHPAMLYETPATISFTVKEGQYIQQKRYVSCYRSTIFTINNGFNSIKDSVG